MPARIVRTLSDEERAGIRVWAEKYAANAAYCLEHGINTTEPLPS
jgi:hypothetical protein